MSTILQISDPHFGTERPEVVEALERMTRAIAPELLIVSGDITQRARRAQFTRAREFLDRIAIARRLVIPGNHDIPLFNLAARVLAPYAGYRRAFGDELEPAIETERLHVSCVKTTRRYRHVQGEVSRAQIERVASRLRAARPGQLRLVVTHQPVHVIREHDLDNLLRGHQRALRAWADAGADLVLGGHIHLPYVRLLDRRLTGASRPIWVVQAGTAVSSRVRSEAPNSVNVIRFDPEPRRCIVERWDFTAVRGTFELAEPTEVTLAEPA